MSLAYRLRPAAAAEREGALILFHGRGADELDLIPLLDRLDPERRLIGVAPRGPLALPPGGAHWYAVRQVGYPDPATFRPTFERASHWLDALAAEIGVPIERTLLGGFSQGAVMSYALGLARGRPVPAGILALSGFIPTVEGFEPDLSGRRNVPVAIGHGSFDTIIAVEWARRARHLLEDAGLAVTYRESPLAHAIDPRYLLELSHWVAATTQAAAQATTRRAAETR